MRLGVEGVSSVVAQTRVAQPPHRPRGCRRRGRQRRLGSNGCSSAILITYLYHYTHLKQAAPRIQHRATRAHLLVCVPAGNKRPPPDSSPTTGETITCEWARFHRHSRHSCSHILPINALLLQVERRGRIPATLRGVGQPATATTLGSSSAAGSAGWRCVRRHGRADVRCDFARAVTS
jgi:hypothetical protein